MDTYKTKYIYNHIGFLKTFNEIKNVEFLRTILIKADDLSNKVNVNGYSRKTKFLYATAAAHSRLFDLRISLLISVDNLEMFLYQNKDYVIILISEISN